MMRKALLPAVFAAILLGSVAFAADDQVCPPQCKPKTPTCEQRIARAKAAGCQMPVEVKIVDHRVEVPGPERIVTREVPGPERIVEHRVEVPVLVQPPPPKGHWLVGLGPLWRDTWGAQAVAGYSWPNGWGIVGGPVWLPGHDVHGSVYGCGQPDCPECGKGGYGCTVCLDLPYTVRAPSPWGATALVTYTFP